MKRIETIVESCEDCRFCQRFYRISDDRECAFICEKTQRVIEMGNHIEPNLIYKPHILPEFCPLEIYKDSDAPSAPSTIILPGLPHLEWMTENLTGFGGTEIDGRTYYTWEEAMAAAEQLGDGWRLPTENELDALCDLGSTWDDERKGRWFGGNHDTDHKDSLFMPAAGLRYRETGALTEVGAFGDYWSSSSYAAGCRNAGYLWFHSGGVGPLLSSHRAYAFSVRCVRNIK